MHRRHVLAAALIGIAAISHPTASHGQRADQRPFMLETSRFNTDRLLTDWRWLVPPSETPLMISAMGDWVFGRPDGSLAKLDILEGVYVGIAQNSRQFNELKASEAWLNKTFSFDWFVIATQRGLVPAPDQCLGWKQAPVLGGKFAVANLALYDMAVYQLLQGQLHRQLRQSKAR